MIEKIFYGKSYIYLMLIPFSIIYGLIVNVIRFLYKRKLLKTHKFHVPILIVGNLSIGGNGKTPLVIFLANKLKKRGWKVGIVSRGYKGKSKRYPIIINKKTDCIECGDEPFLIFQRTESLVSVSPNRSEAALALLKKQSIDIIISDDGLQHYSLFRDIELVVIDGKKKFGNGWWIPAGPMRERISRLRSVHGIIVNGRDQFLGKMSMKLVHENKIINVYNKEKKPISILTSVIAIAGIAHPSTFFSTIRAIGIVPILEISFSDHQIYKKEIFDMLVLPHEQLLMTEKDAVKCYKFSKENWWYLPINAELTKFANYFLINMIEKVILNYKNKNICSTKDIII